MAGFSTITKSRQRRGSIVVKATEEAVKTSSKRRLAAFHELPDWQKDNDLIWTGYVKETNSIRACLRSMTYFNNESVNIYTHLVPSITYLVVLLLLTQLVLDKVVPGSTFREYLMINLYLVGAVTCLMCSSCFHCLKHHSEKHNNVWSKVDYVGIIVQISCSILSLLYYGLYDQFSLFLFFACFTLVLSCCCTVFVLHDKFNSVAFRPIRAVFFTVFGLSGIIPVLAGYLHPGIAGWMIRIQLKFVIIEAIFYILGVVLYGLRIPEALAPGKFDFVGHSHQIFHIMVVLGSICHFRALIGSYVYMSTGKHYSGLLMLS
ncbi:HEL334Wp [Eremothecium sinecaudum]|uniref:HEL334Wp n=1 Tax=Eremothecium sinecaudum TaxID=45286 RepID=A0A0X8HSZ3_9SACH|nr:HEL334Wp [Eremothecium sinecaudum]AMD20947.1 HEL334Wp [Eremothecium sinecaudum]